MSQHVRYLGTQVCSKEGTLAFIGPRIKIHSGNRGTRGRSQTARLSGSNAARQEGVFMDRKARGEPVRLTGRQAGRQDGRQAGSHAVMQAGRQADSQARRQAGNEAVVGGQAGGRQAGILGSGAEEAKWKECRHAGGRALGLTGGKWAGGQAGLHACRKCMHEARIQAGKRVGMHAGRRAGGRAGARAGRWEGEQAVGQAVAQAGGQAGTQAGRHQGRHRWSGR